MTVKTHSLQSKRKGSRQALLVSAACALPCPNTCMHISQPEMTHSICRIEYDALDMPYRVGLSLACCVSIGYAESAKLDLFESSSHCTSQPLTPSTPHPHLPPLIPRPSNIKRVTSATIPGGTFAKAGLPVIKKYRTIVAEYTSALHPYSCVQKACVRARSCACMMC